MSSDQSSNYINHHERKKIAERSKASVSQIIEEVCQKYGLRYDWIVSSRRARHIAWPRQEIMWRAANETAASLPMIGRMLGGRDHTTILHGIKRHQERTASNGTT